jgi:hypothetical protein
MTRRRASDGVDGDNSDNPDALRRKAKRPRKPASPPTPLIEAMGPPISSVAWAAEVVAQTLEILTIELVDGEIRWLKPLHAESLRVGLPREKQPGEVVLGVMAWYPLTPRVAHSTSWRYEAGRVILTYIVVVEPPERLAPDSLIAMPVARATLARGEAMTPPPAIGVAAVLEHALRHLSWLIKDDQAIATALADWRDVLSDYQPEPFRALG